MEGNAIIIPINRIERKPNSCKYRIVSKGVTVEFLSCLIDDPDWPMARICENYGLTPAEVYAAWAFYYDHRDEIDQTIARDSERFDQDNDQDGRRERVKERYVTKTGKSYPEA